MPILYAEGAAAFEELTLSHGLDQLKMQVPDAWPNLFRQSRFLSAVDLVQADRLRRLVAERDGPRLRRGRSAPRAVAARRDAHDLQPDRAIPSLTLRAGFVEVEPGAQRLGARPGASRCRRSRRPGACPTAITLIGRLFDEGTLGRAGIALERAFGVADERPPGF